MVNAKDVDADEVVRLYNKPGESIRSVAEAFGMSYGACHYLLSGKCALKPRGRGSTVADRRRPPRDTADLAASDHTVRRIFVALQANGPMRVSDLMMLPGCTNAPYRLKRLCAEGYIRQTDAGLYALTGAGSKLAEQSDRLYAQRQPLALLARHEAGQTYEAIARDVGLSVSEVGNRLRWARR